jgi:hypothetical protein
MFTKKIITPLIILIVAIGIFLFLKRDKVSTLQIAETDFAVEDVNKIDKIFIRSRFQNDAALLTKNNKGVWFINDKYEADGAKVGVLLSAIKDVKVKYPVGNDFWDEVVRQLSSTGMKVELYNGSKKLKTYYVGGPTPDHMGTFYWMEDAERPYVVHIEGFQGYLSPRFFVTERDWRSKVLFSYEPKEIEWVKVEWVQEPTASFRIENTNNEPILQNIDGKAIKQVNDNKLRSYLNHFDKLAHEGFPQNKRAPEIDSIYNQGNSFVTLTLKPKNKEEQKLQIFYKELTRGSYQQLDLEGVQIPFDVDSYYAFFNNNAGELLQIQDFVFGKVLKKVADFKLE